MCLLTQSWSKSILYSTVLLQRIIPIKRWVIDQVQVKMAGYRPSSFFFFACLCTEADSRSRNMQQKRSRPISSYLDQTKFIICKKSTIFFRGTVGNPEQADSPVLLARVANYSAGFASSCPLTKHIIFTHKPI